MSYFYISNPYNGTEEQKEQRARLAAEVCGKLLKKGIFAWSPIVHNHAMMKVYDQFSLEERKELVLEFDFSLLQEAQGMIVLTIDGWKESYGVNKEIELCEELEIPVTYIDPSKLDEDIELDIELE